MLKTICMTKHTCRQMLLSSIGLCQGMSSGAVFAFSSVLFYQLEYDQSIVLETNEASWIVSIPLFIMMPSCLLSGLIMETLGRKLTLLILDMLGFVAWLLTFVGVNYTMLISARALFGVYLGLSYPTILTFLGEVSVPHYRTVVLTAVPLGSAFGSFACKFLAEYLHWKMVAAIFAFCPLYNIAVLLNIKESFVKHLARNDIGAARSYFEWFRGSYDATKQEFEEILEAPIHKTKTSYWQVLRICASKEFLMPLAITTTVFLTNELAGTQAVTYVSLHILQVVNKDEDLIYYATLGLNGLKIIGIILSIIIVKLSSVRICLIASGYLLSVSLLTLGVFMYCSHVYSDPIFPLLTLIALIMNTALCALGINPLPSVICGEMFPHATRSIGISLSASLSFLFLFVGMHFMPILFHMIGPCWAFLFFGLCTLLGIALTHAILPDTKNMTLQEINKMYQKKQQSKSQS